MAAIVRVKRRIDEESADSLVLSCKRIKKSDPSEQKDIAFNDITEKSNFKFAGTVTIQEACVTKTVRDAIRKEKLQREYKQHTVDRLEKARTSHRLTSVKNRYKIVSQGRALDLDSLNTVCQVSSTEAACTEKVTTATENSDASGKVYCLYDVEPEQPVKTVESCAATPDTITCNGVPMTREKVAPLAPPGDSQYVYDIYYMNKADFDFRSLENILAIEAYGPDLVFDDDRREPGEVYDDDDDSNDEDNWRNDYPDEDPKFYENEDVEYYYGEDGRQIDHGFSSDEGGNDLIQCLNKQLQLEENSDDSDDELDHPGTKTSTLRTAKNTYETYMEKARQELDSDGHT